MQAVFMIGEQRSGSNLLRCILNESPEVAAPHPPHILQRMMPIVSRYGNLARDEHFDHLVEDVCRLVELNPVKWENIDKFDRADVKARCSEHSLVAVFGAVMDIYAQAHNAKAWMCKSMQNVRWASEINAYFKTPKYIYLYRDPRDVTLSFTKAVVGEKHPYFIAHQWAELQRLCIELKNRLNDSSLFALRYEELIDQPETVVKSLCDFLNIPFSPAMLSSFSGSGEAQRTAESSQLWQNLTKPIMRDNSKKFLKELKRHDIEVVESVCGDIMDSLGYERELVPKGRELQFNRTEIAEFTKINTRLKNKMELQTDPEDLKRRKLQATVISQTLKKAC